MPSNAWLPKRSGSSSSSLSSSSSGSASRSNSLPAWSSASSSLSSSSIAPPFVLSLSLPSFGSEWLRCSSRVSSSSSLPAPNDQGCERPRCRGGEGDGDRWSWWCVWCASWLRPRTRSLDGVEAMGVATVEGAARVFDATKIMISGVSEEAAEAGVAEVLSMTTEESDTAGLALLASLGVANEPLADTEGDPPAFCRACAT